MNHPEKIPPPLTRRIDLNVGYSCNIKCRFCYYINDVRARQRDKDLTTVQCKRLIDRLRAEGMEALDITGGEPTIRPDLFELVSYARDAGFARIAVITNGIRLANLAYAKELVAAGVNDFLFSLHGSSAASHDFVTCVGGSYDLLLKAIRNLLGLSVKVRCNSVVTGSNIHDVYARAQLVRELGIVTLNFIIFNPIEQAKGSSAENFLRYSDAAVPLKRAIDDLGPDFKKFTVRYMPFCLMKGYEAHLQNVHQVHYDHDEWNYLLRARIREPYWKWLGGLAVGYGALPAKARWARWGTDHTLHAAILEAHSRLNKCRPGACRGCAYAFICGGVWKEYARRFGAGELTAHHGPLIVEPWHFMTNSQRAVEA
ncbi:MAG: radical SAM protein [Candidatus Omnitrophota bacterium]